MALTCSVCLFASNLLHLQVHFELTPALVTADDQVKAYIKKIMSQLNKWMAGGKISKLVVVITDRETGEHVERWQFDVRRPLPLDILWYLMLELRLRYSGSLQRAEAPENLGIRRTPLLGRLIKFHPQNHRYALTNIRLISSDAEPQAEQPVEKTEKEIQDEIQAIFRQITASVTFLPVLDGDCTFNVLVYADANSEVPVEWGDSDAKEIKNAEKVQLRSFSTNSHKVGTLVSYRMAD